MPTKKAVSQETRDALLDTELRYIGQRLAGVEASISQISADAKAYAVIQFDVAALQDKVKSYAAQEKNYVTQDQYWPVKVLVFGFTSILLITVVGAIVALVVRSPT